MRILSRAARAAAARYRSVPASVLYPQLFLGLGWIRAAVAHGVAESWWAGEDLLNFLDKNEALRLPFYGPFVDLVVLPMPVVVSLVVAGLQMAIGVALMANIRPVASTLIGMFLNVHFIMAGAVNPSVFYVVMGMAVVLSIMRGRMTPARAHKIAVRATIMALVAALVCGPFITTFDPARVIEDPSLILICLSVLFAVSFWLMFGELTGAAEAVVETGGAPVRSEGALPVSGNRPAAGRTDQARSGPGTMGAGRGVRSSSLETDLQQLRAASPEEIMEAMDRPIPKLTTQETMTYHEDVDSGFSIRVTETDDVEPKPQPESPRSIAKFDVKREEAPLQWYSVRCHFKADDRHYEERITVWQATGFDDAIELAEAEAEIYAKQLDGSYLGSCDAFHLSDARMQASQGAEIYSLLRASDLDPDTYLRTFFFTGSERSAEV